MRQALWRGAILGAIALAIGCSGDSNRSRDVTAADVQKEAHEAAATTSDYVKVRRQRLLDRARRTSEDVEQELASAREELEALPGDAKQRLSDAIDAAEGARDALSNEAKGLQESGEESWETAQKRVDDALAELDEARREVSAALAGHGTSTETS